MSLCRPEAHFDIHLCLEEFLEKFNDNLSRYLTYTTENERDIVYRNLRREYLSHLWLLNEPAEFYDVTASRKFQGMIRGLSPVGHILIEDTENGRVREFAFKEVSYII